MKFIIVPIILILGILGCHNPEKAIYRESMDKNVAPFLNDWQAWAPLMTATPENPNGQREKLPLLTPNQLQNGKSALNKYFQTRDEDRQRDNESWFNSTK